MVIREPTDRVEAPRGPGRSLESWNECPFPSGAGSNTGKCVRRLSLPMGERRPNKIEGDP